MTQEEKRNIIEEAIIETEDKYGIDDLMITMSFYGIQTTRKRVLDQLIALVEKDPTKTSFTYNSYGEMEWTSTEHSIKDIELDRKKIAAFTREIKLRDLGI